LISLSVLMALSNVGNSVPSPLTICLQGAQLKMRLLPAPFADLLNLALTIVLEGGASP
jgi:hypothetical protein